MNKSLVFFSAGKDSFIATCRTVEDGNHVTLISYNSGSVVGEENLVTTAERLVKHYGSDKIEYAGVYNTAGLYNRYRKSFDTTPFSTIAEKLPNLCISQARCMMCQSAMWTAGVGYCIAHEIDTIVTGYRSSDVFCTGSKEFLLRMTSLAEKHGIHVSLPVWDTKSWDELDGFYRDNEMIRRRFQPAVLEPKCMAGLPCEAMSDDQESDLIKCYDICVAGMIDEQIQRLVPMFKSFELTDKSLI